MLFAIIMQSKCLTIDNQNIYTYFYYMTKFNNVLSLINQLDRLKNIY
jgi:hypothetical protein